MRLALCASSGRALRHALHALPLALLALFTFVLAPLASALPNDREQPIHITADRAVRDEKRGVTIYSGHVQMRQGSMELDADSLTIYHEARDADKFVARGKPARMRQQPELDKGLVHAHANVITYFRHEELVNLRTGARLTRDDGTLVTGDSIDYFIAKELVKADSDRNDDSNKVFVVIPPSVIGDTEDQEAAEGAGSDEGAESEQGAEAAEAAVSDETAVSGEDAEIDERAEAQAADTTAEEEVARDSDNAASTPPPAADQESPDGTSGGTQSE